MTDLKILLIQSDQRSLDAVRAQFHPEVARGAVVMGAQTVQAALARLAEKSFDAALLDLDLAGMHKLDGFILLHLNAPFLPVLVFSEMAHEALGLEAVRAGAQTYLTRAELEAPVVVRAVQYAIERHALGRATYSHAEQLQFSEARFRLLINENADGIVVVNMHGLIRFVNPAAEAMFGRPRHALIGASFCAPLEKSNMAIIEIARGYETILAQQRVVATMWERENVLIVTLRDVTVERLALAQLEDAQKQEARQRRVAQALADSAAALNSTLHFEQVVDRILENIGRVVPHDAACVFLIQDEVARYVRGHGFAERGLAEWMEQLQLPITQHAHLQEMRRTRRALVIPATRLDGRWIRLENEWVGSFVGAPLCVRDDTIGFLMLDSETEDFYTSAHAAALQAFADQAAMALDNARLHAQVEQRANEWAMVYGLVRELARQAELQPMLETLLWRATEIFRAPCGNLSLYMPETQGLETRASVGKPESIAQLRQLVGDGVIGRVALTKQPLLLDDYNSYEFRLPQVGDDEIGAILSVPMLYGGEVEGVLTVHERNGSARRFQQADLHLLALIATQAAALVHNARLHQETAQRAQQLALVYDAGLTLNRELEPRVQLDFLTRIAMRALHAERAAFFRYDAGPRELILDFALGFDKEGPAYDNRTRIALETVPGIEAWVARERVPARLPDATRDARFAPSADNLRSGIWVPVEHEGNLLGVLAVASTKPNAFLREEERLLSLYASQAAVALENARLYQSLLRENERRDILHWASQEVVSAGLDAERVYAAIHQAVSRLMPCEAFVLALLDESGAQIELAYSYDPGGRQYIGTISKERGLSGKIIGSDTALIVGNLAESKLESINYGYPVQVVSVLGVPMRYGGQVIGALLTESYAENAYEDADRVRLEMLAAHAAAACMNARGYENLRRALAQISERDQTFVQSESDRFGAIGGAELAKNRADVEFDRMRGDE